MKICLSWQQLQHFVFNMKQIFGQTWQSLSRLYSLFLTQNLRALNPTPRLYIFTYTNSSSEWSITNMHLCNLWLFFFILLCNIILYTNSHPFILTSKFSGGLWFIFFDSVRTLNSVFKVGRWNSDQTPSDFVRWMKTRNMHALGRNH